MFVKGLNSLSTDCMVVEAIVGALASCTVDSASQMVVLNTGVSRLLVSLLLDPRNQSRHDTSTAIFEAISNLAYDAALRTVLIKEGRNHMHSLILELQL